MPSIFTIKEIINNPKSWFEKAFKLTNPKWEYDDILNAYHLDEIYLS